MQEKIQKYKPKHKFLQSELTLFPSKHPLLPKRARDSEQTILFHPDLLLQDEINLIFPICKVCENLCFGLYFYIFSCICHFYYIVSCIEAKKMRIVVRAKINRGNYILAMYQRHNTESTYVFVHSHLLIIHMI